MALAPVSNSSGIAEPLTVAATVKCPSMPRRKLAVPLRESTIAEVGGIVRSRVQAFVADRGALDGSLLGMTFLETLSKYSVSGDRLELSD